MLRYKEIKRDLLLELSKYTPEDRLPSRPFLCKKLDTTRTTLDKAIRELEEEGFLISKKGSGTYVAGLLEGGTSPIGNWGVIVPNVMEEIYPGLVRGAENVAQRYGVNTIICNSDNDPDKQEQYVKRLLLSGVSGMIIVPVVSNDIRVNFRLYNQLASAKTPFVFCNRSVEGINVPTVTSNDFYGGYIAAKHLIAHNYRNIAYIAKLKYKTSIDRCQGYLSALMEQGLPINRKLIRFDSDCYRAMKDLIESSEALDAVFCFNDEVAQKCYQAISESGKQISDDIGIIGYDNTDTCKMLPVPLTSVAYKNYEIGEKAAELLWGMINHQPLLDFEYYLFQPSIVERNSCMGVQNPVSCSCQEKGM